MHSASDKKADTASFPLASKYASIKAKVEEKVSDLANLNGYLLLIDSYESIEVLMTLLNNPTKARSLDEIALIHLSYQTLGSA